MGKSLERSRWHAFTNISTRCAAAACRRDVGKSQELSRRHTFTDISTRCAATAAAVAAVAAMGDEESRCLGDINITIRSPKAVEGLASCECVHMPEECMFDNNRKDSVANRLEGIR